MKSVHEGLKFDIINIKSDQMAFSEENMRILNKLEKLDITVTKRAENMADNTLAEFKIIVKSFEDTLKIEYKGWR